LQNEFSILRNDNGTSSMNVRKNSTVPSYFVVYLPSLILRTRLFRMLKESGSKTEDSVMGLSTGFERIRLIVFPDGTKLPAGMTKRSRKYWLLSNVEIIQSR